MTDLIRLRTGEYVCRCDECGACHVDRNLAKASAFALTCNCPGPDGNRRRCSDCAQTHRINTPTCPTPLSRYPRRTT